MSEPSFKNFLKKSKFNHKKAKTYLKAYKLIKETNLFDEEFYKNNYPNVADSQMDPLTHYLFYGANEGKYPSTNFNGNKYLNTYPETINRKINPLVHYILEGKEKGYETFPVQYTEQYEKIIKNNLLYLNNYTFADEPLVSIIILNRNGYHHLKTLFKNFKEKTNYNNYEIIIVDNASTDKSIEYLETLNENIKIIKNTTNKSFSQANNEAVEQAKGEYILLLNNDIEPTYGWLNELVGTITQDENIAAVGGKLIYPYYFDRISIDKSFKLQHATVKFEEVITQYYDYGPIHEDLLEEDIFNQKYNQNKECFGVTAAVVLIRKSIYQKLGGLDENYFYGYEDVDFMLKLHKNNYKVIYAGASLLFHHESSTRNDNEFAEINLKNIKVLMKNWEKYLFKQILIDKIEQNKFFTNQTLTISLVDNEEKTNFKTISQLSKELNQLNYNMELIPETHDLLMSKDTDIVISFNTNYNIKKIHGRKNIIKIFLTEEKINKELEEKTKDYNIIITTNNENKEIEKENLFIINKIGTNEILNTIKTFYKIE